MIRYVIGLALLTFLFSPVASLAQVYLDVIDFETGDFSQWRIKCSRCAQDNRHVKPTLITSPTRGGQYAGRYQQIGSRSESSSKPYPRDTELWAGWALYIPKDFAQTDATGAHVSQFHARQIGESFGEANFFVEAKNEDGSPEWGVWLKSAGIRKELDRPIQEGEWTEFVLHVNWTHTNKGFLELWIKDSQGEQKYTIVEKGRTYYGNEYSDGPYFKAGIYGSGAGGNPRAFTYVDEFRIMEGSQGGYDDVSPCKVLGDCGGSTPEGGSDEVATVSVGNDTYQVKWVDGDNFSDGNWQDRWVLESSAGVPASASVVNGRLQIDDPAGSEGVTVWFKNSDLPTDFFVRYKVRGSGFVNKINFNHFTHAREKDGSDLAYIRDGNYENYHFDDNPDPALQAYLATFVSTWSRLRMEPNFALLSEDLDTKSTLEVTYEIVMTVVDGRINYYVDGQLVHDYAVDEPLPGGSFGIRTKGTQAWWDDFEFGQIVGSTSAKPKPN